MTPDCYAVSLSMIQRFGSTQLHTLLNLIQVQSYGDVLHPHVREGKKNDRDSVPLSWSSAQVCIVACTICFERDVSHVWKFGENRRICSPSSQIRPCMSSLFLAEGTFGPIIKLLTVYLVVPNEYVNFHSRLMFARVFGRSRATQSADKANRPRKEARTCL